MTITTLKDLYVDQLQDLYSANRQAIQVTRELKEAASSAQLRKALTAGVDGIEEGMDHLKTLIENHDANPRGEHCKGMEGLAAEARAHGVEADFSDEDVRDASIIAQYQRMTHYGITGYGTARAFARSASRCEAGTASHAACSKSGCPSGASSERFLRPMPKLTVSAIWLATRLRSAALVRTPVSAPPALPPVMVRSPVMALPVPVWLSNRRLTPFEKADPT